MKKTLLSILACGSIGMASAQLVDPSFEAGAGAYWTEASTNFDTPLCDLATCGADYSVDGTWFYWGGGIAAGTFEETLLAQQLIIPAGTSAELSYSFRYGNPGDGNLSLDDAFYVKLDGNVLFTVLGDNTTDYAQYSIIQHDISAYADGALHYLEVSSVQDGGTSFYLDAFNLTVNGQTQTTVNEVMNREKEISFFPNPANENINVQFNQAVSGTATISIFDATGSLVNRDQVNQITNKIFTLDVTQLPNGVYFMNVDNNGTQFQQRFVVAH